MLDGSSDPMCQVSDNNCIKCNVNYYKESNDKYSPCLDTCPLNKIKHEESGDRYCIMCSSVK